MKLNLTKSYCELIRETGDKAMSSENAVTHAIKTMLLARGTHAARRRGNVGLTACKQVLYSKTLKAHIWHERYQIEDTHREFNAGSVVYMITPDSQL